MKINLSLISMIICFHFVTFVFPEETKPSIKKIVVFGDSLSDNGNYLKASKLSDNPMPLEPYFQGRASNGKVWIEYLSSSINSSLYDHAYLGAVTSGKNPKYPLAIDLVSQIELYLKDNKVQFDSNNTLYVILIGANNIFTMNYKKPIETFKSLWNMSSNIIDSIEKLQNNGAKYFLIGNLPDLGKIALTNEISIFKKIKWGLSLIVRVENFVIAKKIHHLKIRNDEKNFKIITFNTKNILDEIEKKVATFNIKNSNNSCYIGVPSDPPNPNVTCLNPKDYLYWDLVHPTTKVHCLAAIDIQKKLANNFNIPVPNEQSLKKCLAL